MDTKTGQIYPDRKTALNDLIGKGVPKKQAERRIIEGSMPTLRKLRKMIRKQIEREARP